MIFPVKTGQKRDGSRKLPSFLPYHPEPDRRQWRNQ